MVQDRRLTAPNMKIKSRHSETHESDAGNDVALPLGVLAHRYGDHKDAGGAAFDHHPRHHRRLAHPDRRSETWFGTVPSSSERREWLSRNVYATNGGPTRRSSPPFPSQENSGRPHWRPHPRPPPGGPQAPLRASRSRIGAPSPK